MLVLSRKKEQQIVVEGPCVITIVDVRGDVVRVGIEADKSVNIVRAELIEPKTESEADDGTGAG